LIFLNDIFFFEQKNTTCAFSFEIFTAADIDIENVAIPAMLIQPLLENSVKHGIANKENGVLKLSFLKDENALYILVDDNGNGRQQTSNLSHDSKAISILEKRILAFNTEHGFMQNNPIIYTDKKDSTESAAGTSVNMILHYLELY
jgi:LytS/YehU family sensor histidine kinase